MKPGDKGPSAHSCEISKKGEWLAQVLQDQLQSVRRLLAAQQADTKRLSEQVSALTEAVEGLRHSLPVLRVPRHPPPRPPATVGPDPIAGGQERPSQPRPVPG